MLLASSSDTQLSSSRLKRMSSSEKKELARAGSSASLSAKEALRGQEGKAHEWSRARALEAMSMGAERVPMELYDPYEPYIVDVVVNKRSVVEGCC